MKIPKRLKSHWFSLAMAALFLIAWIRPSLPGFLNSGGWMKKACIMIIFFISGLSLRSEEILKGFSNWKIHLYIQGFCYLFIPLFFWSVLKGVGGFLPEGLVIGFYLLAVLPITITSCVVFTQLAGGNFAAALFNAVLGNTMGIILTPALFLLMMGTTDMSIEMDTVGTIMKLGLMVVAPLVVGQIVRLFFRDRTRQFRKTGSLVNRWAILLIVYFAFGQIFTGESVELSFSGMILPLVLIVPAHFVILLLAGAGGRLFGFSGPDRIAIAFCAPQKTLAMGIPLIAAVLASRPDLEGLASLPIIVYHPTQLLVAGFLEERFHARMGSDGNGANLSNF